MSSKAAHAHSGAQSRRTQLLVLTGVLIVGVLVVSGAAFLNSRPLSPFDGRRAYIHLEKLVAMGPRVPGTDGNTKARAYIKQELARVGLEIREHAFTADTPLGSRAMANITGIVQGTGPGLILLSNHFDTKYFPNFTFVGANDGGSTAAWMLEMARALGPRREGSSVWLCFFDGEEAFEKWTDADSLYGSRAFVKRLEETGEASRVRALVNVDMIGDCKLGIFRDPDAPQWLQDAVWNEAKRLGYDKEFLSQGRRMDDDHIPFRRAGIAALNLIDFEYGGSTTAHDNTWHTPRDTIDKVCADSLQAVGDVIYHALPVIDSHAGE